MGSSTGLPTDEMVTEAYQEWNNHKRLEAINTDIQEIEIALKKVMPSETNEA
ncbi:hypothetical protein [Nostoc sp. FACHB-190]|uniref:hypothetical protein n=1 Tax=Nostoc sp. FACHB-190 TaxID=2692838 RepID=UPI001687C25E|nr:hypothetical protein [Nostoc sp. FACHB-190]MBD2302271.1 hypothetical protein [Nostoc sp. FACHB-190]